MNTEELFINSNELPELLTKEEFNILMDKVKLGDEESLNEIILHNIKLVLHRVCTKFKNVECDKKELVSIGNIGLIKAVRTFDKNKNTRFSTYATVCIDNEILMFLRKNNQKTFSLDDLVNEDDENSLNFKDFVVDRTDIVETCINKEKKLIIRKILNELPIIDREIILMHYGFYGKKYTQKEIAKKFNVQPQHISRKIRKILVIIKAKLEKEQIIEKCKKSFNI